MLKGKHIAILLVAGSIYLAACNSSANKPPVNSTPIGNTPQSDTAVSIRKVAMVISSIPFPSSILDTLHSVHAAFQTALPNSTDNMNLYSESNTQSVNLGIYGADLAYVISFEQFQDVGKYMKATKFLADNVGIPMAFTQDVIERCQKNQNNKDSLSRIVYESYNVIDKTLKDNQRKASEVLVLTGGWVEGMYLTTQGIGTITVSTDKQAVYRVFLEQKKYLDKLLSLLDVITDSPYCQKISNSLHEIRGAFNNITDATSVKDEALNVLTEKVKELRILLVKGGNA